MVSVPLPCACLAGSIGYDVSEDVMVGVNYYQGAGFMFSEYFAKQYGVFTRYKLFSSSFFIQLRLGKMHTTQRNNKPSYVDYESDHLHIRDSGRNWGADIGSEWDIEPEVFLRMIWLGKDEYFKSTKASRLPHFMRYQIGYRF